jgi:hypothetical protein
MQNPKGQGAIASDAHAKEKAEAEGMAKGLALAIGHAGAAAPPPQAPPRAMTPGNAQTFRTTPGPVYPPMAMGGGVPVGPAPGTSPGDVYSRVQSDERTKGGKERNHGDESDADRFMDHLHPYSYKYKDPALAPNPTGGHARQLGVMAQDVEKSPFGEQIVQATPQGKALSLGAMVSAHAASIGRLHERLGMLEGRGRG